MKKYLIASILIVGFAGSAYAVTGQFGNMCSWGLANHKEQSVDFMSSLITYVLLDTREFKVAIGRLQRDRAAHGQTQGGGGPATLTGVSGAAHTSQRH